MYSSIEQGVEAYSLSRKFGGGLAEALREAASFVEHCDTFGILVTAIQVDADGFRLALDREFPDSQRAHLSLTKLDTGTVDTPKAPLPVEKLPTERVKE